MPRFSLLTLLVLVTAASLLMAFPRYFLAVGALFLAVLLFLAFIGWQMGPLDQEKLNEYRRLSSRTGSDSESGRPPNSDDVRRR